MMRKTLIAAGAAVAALITGGVLAVIVPASVPAATPHNYSACNGHSGVQYDSKIAYECVYRDATGPILYWSVNKFIAEYYLNPSGTSGMVAGEIYFRTCAQDLAISGEKCPLGLPLAPQSNGRIISLADGCLVPAPSQTTIPVTCTATSAGGQPGATQPMTPAEQATITAFYKIMHAAVPNSQW